MYLTYVLFGSVAISLSVALEPFVTWWAGEIYLLDSTETLLVCISFFFMGVTSVGNVFRDAFGLFIQGWLRPLLTAVLLLVLSLILVGPFGLVGLLSAQAGAFVLVPLWFDPWIVNRHALNSKPWRFYGKVLSWMFVLCVVWWVASNWMLFATESYLLDAVLRGAASGLLCLSVLSLTFWRSQENRFIRARIGRLLVGIVKR